MSNLDSPIDIEQQVQLMKKYVVFSRKTRMVKMLEYTGYYRASRYGKYLLSYTNIMKTKPKQDLLFDVYDFDLELRKLFFNYCKKAEIQFKSTLSNSISLKTNDPTFYIDKQYYTETKGAKDKIKRNSNKVFFNNKFINSVIAEEENLRMKSNKYPELSEYRKGGARSEIKIPSWAAFSYFEFGTITNMYAYLNGSLRKEVLKYGYSRTNYGKNNTNQVDTWLDAIRNLRNICAHHNRLISRTSSIVLLDSRDNANILSSNTDLFSRVYALKKILSKKDSELLKKDLQKIIKKAKFDIYQFNILPQDWEILFDSINYL